MPCRLSVGSEYIVLWHGIGRYAISAMLFESVCLRDIFADDGCHGLACECGWTGVVLGWLARTGLAAPRRLRIDRVGKLLCVTRSPSLSAVLCKSASYECCETQDAAARHMNPRVVASYFDPCKSEVRLFEPPRLILPVLWYRMTEHCCLTPVAGTLDFCLGVSKPQRFRSDSTVRYLL